MEKFKKFRPLESQVQAPGRLSRLVFPVGLALLVGVAGCAAGTAPAASESEDGETADDTFEAQVERGGALYGEHCAHCHGESGQGTSDAPAVVGGEALPLDPPPERQVRTSQFRTAADVYAFASENMPGDDPASLAPEKMVDILAFALSANGVTLEAPLSLENASSVVLHE